ncbi:peptidoglycan endopeptidase [Sphingomonas sp. R1]|uniref:peptidoglycan endopeptidase n=1 Tax=Sphingomonas sp. R1 TaxID=399176 RepID=UPI002225AF46|nr:peptidoglycan endopeptidase [Sphingomonas sp. R1]UYY76664.1 peptidoglycan endopeptidase [Sphingomonas sp. R1]
MSGATVLAAARRAIGVPFRPQGRDPVSGLDCVGLAALALGRTAPTGYRLRLGDAAAVSHALRAAGLVEVAGAVPGDLLLCRSGPGQLHLAIRSENGIVHADAVARRVVERPGAVPWPVLGCWRLVEND